VELGREHAEARGAAEVAHQPRAHGHAVRIVLVLQPLGLEAGHVDIRRALGFAALARKTEVHDRGNLVAVERPGGVARFCRWPVYDENNAEFLKVVIEVAKETHALLDSSKFNKNALFPVCALPELASLISDAAPSPVIESALRRVHHAPLF
jgi:hypothetical protein